MNNNGGPYSGVYVSVRNNVSGIVEATWYSGSDGCFPSPGLPSFHDGESYTITISTTTCVTQSVTFTACPGGTITITACD